MFDDNNNNNNNDNNDDDDNKDDDDDADHLWMNIPTCIKNENEITILIDK